VVMWEIMDGGDPWPGIDSIQTAHKVAKGDRMLKPMDCPKEVYELMCLCWKQLPEDRPSFEQICDMIDDLQDKLFGQKEEPVSRSKIDEDGKEEYEDQIYN